MKYHQHCVLFGLGLLVLLLASMGRWVEQYFRDAQDYHLDSYSTALLDAIPTKAAASAAASPSRTVRVDLTTTTKTMTSCSDVEIRNHTTRLIQRPCKPITVAYAISLIKCGDGQSTPEGLVDASMVLQHSIHQNSLRAGNQVSYYDYKMYAIVHEQAVSCSQVLQDAGFHVLVRSPPLEVKDIRGDFLRKTIHKEVCCGHDEFIKLYAYTFSEAVVVHADIDFIFHKPMDYVFDALLYDKDSEIGILARQSLERERPTDAWPETPQAFMTRDWPQVFPGRKAAYQAGFIVLRPNPQVMAEIVEIVKEGNFVEGNQPDNGWGGKGYGGFVGAKAMQGLIAYYYDEFAPDTWVELNQCRYNHMGIDTKFNPGGFGYRASDKGTCRNRMTECEDCMHTNTSLIYSIHYTKCRKPWNCIGEGDSTLPKDLPKNSAAYKAAVKKLIPEQLIHVDHCLALLKIWHSVRSNLEHQLLELVQSNKRPTSRHQNSDNNNDNDVVNQTLMVINARRGKYKIPFFQGHCSSSGKYLTLASGHQETLQRIPELYEQQKQRARQQ